MAAVRFLSWVGLGLSTLLVARLAPAREPLLDQVYGQGVHAFFRHDYHQAQELFNTAVSYGSQDPRLYFFRGLTRSKMGRQLEAENDYRTGATLEETAGGSRVGWALERIQGRERLRLEKIRTHVRLDYLRRHPPSLAPAVPRAQPGGPQVPDELTDPFRDDTGGPLGADRVEPAPEPKRPPAAPAEPPPGAPEADPFGATPEAPEEQPAEEPATEKPPAEQPLEADPFGGAPEDDAAAAEAGADDAAPADAGATDAAPADEDATGSDADDGEAPQAEVQETPPADDAADDPFGT